MSISSKTDDIRGEPEAGMIVVGRVSAAHGVKGELRLIPLTDFPERFFRMRTLDLYTEGRLVRTLRVSRVRPREDKGDFIVESDVSDRSEAAKLAGALVMVPADERAPLPDGRFWVDELIGLRVLDEEKNVLGVVEDFIFSGGNELYVVRDGEGKAHYIPAVEEFVRAIDLSSKSIAVRLIEGLW
jgi:16S rRNA processing protein RimM